MWPFLFPFVPSYFPRTRETDTKKAEQFCNIQFLNDKGNHNFFQETKLSYRNKKPFILGVFYIHWTCTMTVPIML